MLLSSCKSCTHIDRVGEDQSDIMKLNYRPLHHFVGSRKVILIITLFINWSEKNLHWTVCWRWCSKSFWEASAPPECLEVYMMRGSLVSHLVGDRTRHLVEMPPRRRRLNYARPIICPTAKPVGDICCRCPGFCWRPLEELTNWGYVTRSFTGCTKEAIPITGVTLHMHRLPSIIHKVHTATNK